MVSVPSLLNGPGVRDQSNLLVPNLLEVVLALLSPLADKSVLPSSNSDDHFEVLDLRSKILQG